MKNLFLTLILFAVAFIAIGSQSNAVPTHSPPGIVISAEQHSASFDVMCFVQTPEQFAESAVIRLCPEASKINLLPGSVGIVYTPLKFLTLDLLSDNVPTYCRTVTKIKDYQLTGYSMKY